MSKHKPRDAHIAPGSYFISDRHQAVALKAVHHRPNEPNGWGISVETKRKDGTCAGFGAVLHKSPTNGHVAWARFHSKADAEAVIRQLGW